MQAVLRSVDIVEARLSEQSSKSVYSECVESTGEKVADSRERRDVSDDEMDRNYVGGSEPLFDASQRCMYLQIQGDGYMSLFEAGKHSKDILLEFAKRSLAAYEAATDLASASLDASDPLRLLVVATYCRALHTLPTLSTDIRNEITGLRKARQLATKTFNNASSSPVGLSNDAIYLMQILRDQWIVEKDLPRRSAHEKGEAAGGTDQEKEQVSSADDDDDVGDSEEETAEERQRREAYEAAQESSAAAAEQEKLAKLQQESKARSIANAKRVRDGGKPPQTMAKKNSPQNIKSLGVFQQVDHPEEKSLSGRIKAAMRDIRRLRGICAPTLESGGRHEPVLLDRDIAHAAHLRAALKRIFNIYVQGSAIVGLQSQGFNVELPDSQVMSIGNFLLEGPFIGFRGFVSILRDFGICRCPLNEKDVKDRGLQKKRGKYFGDGKFPSIYDANDALYMFHNGHPPLNIRDATMLFMECSRSPRPALTMTKYLSNYSKISAESDAMEDSYAQPLAWAAEPVDSWGMVHCGLNFMQFIDFIGKAALVAYSSDKFEAILTSNEEKIEHFLHAQMGLLDARRWLPKVEGRLHSFKEQLKLAHDGGNTGDSALPSSKLNSARKKRL